MQEYRRREEKAVEELLFLQNIAIYSMHLPSQPKAENK
jgi:hypothetical protein